MTVSLEVPQDLQVHRGDGVDPVVICEKVTIYAGCHVSATADHSKASKEQQVEKLGHP